MGFFQKLVYGEDLEAEQAKSDELDRKLHEQNQKAFERGAISQEVYNATQQNIGAGTLNVEAEVNQAFKEGVQEGIDNIKGSVDSVLTLPFKFISWRVWLIAGAVLFVWMGGLGFLKGKLK